MTRGKPTLDQTIFPDKEDFSNRKAEELINLWRKNHRIIFDYLKSVDTPYFGLHGTNKENLEAIHKSKRGHFELATFYDKEKTEMRLFQLYNLCDYVHAYALKNNSSGGILIFNLEEEGRNITHPWEHLKPGSGLEQVLTLDSDIETKMFESFRHKNNLLWRTDIVLNPDTFSTYYKGTISFEKKGKYFSKYS